MGGSEVNQGRVKGRSGVEKSTSSRLTSLIIFKAEFRRYHYPPSLSHAHASSSNVEALDFGVDTVDELFWLTVFIAEI